LDVGFTARQISRCSHLFELQPVSDGLSIAFTISSDDRPNTIRVIFKRRLQKMKRITFLKAVVFCLGIGAGVALVSVRAHADVWDQKTVFTFSEPIEIPGQVLDAGTYVFKVADSASDRNIVQVFTEDESHLYGTFLTVPDYHQQPSGKTIINFEERVAGDPEAVKAWFYPGDNYGHDFVYPKAKAAALAKANNQTVASMPDELAGKTTRPAKSMNESSVAALKKTPLKAQRPTGEEAQVADVFAAAGR
jgi:hypothetical protein